MKKSKFTEAQMAFALKQVELGTKVEEVCRKRGISQATFYNWFISLEDAKQKIEAWREEYNSFRPHSSLDGLTPNQVHDASQKHADSSTYQCVG